MRWSEFLSQDNLAQLLVGSFPEGPMGGLLLTLYLGSVAIVFSLLLGIVLAFLRSLRHKILSIPAAIYIEFFRGVPLVMVFFWMWFVPPYFGIYLSGIVSAALALILFTAAYNAEIIRGGLRSVDKGQAEVAAALGLTHLQSFRYVVLPQAIRAMIPALTSRAMVTIMNTSLGFLIGLKDLTGVARLINARILAPVEAYLFALVVYFIVNRGLSYLGLYLERRMNPDAMRPTPADLRWQEAL